MLQLSFPFTCNETNYSHSIKTPHITPSTPISNLGHQWHLKDTSVLEHSSCKTSSVCRCVEEKMFILEGGAKEPGEQKSRHDSRVCVHVCLGGRQDWVCRSAESTWLQMKFWACSKITETKCSYAVLLICIFSSECRMKIVPAPSHRKPHSKCLSMQPHVAWCLAWAHFQLYTILINPLWSAVRNKPKSRIPAVPCSNATERSGAAPGPSPAQVSAPVTHGTHCRPSPWPGQTQLPAQDLLSFVCRWISWHHLHSWQAWGEK